MLQKLIEISSSGAKYFDIKYTAQKCSKIHYILKAFIGVQPWEKMYLDLEESTNVGACSLVLIYFLCNVTTLSHWSSFPDDSIEVKIKSLSNILSICSVE